jgi:predicted nucleic acid-binding protein
VTAIIPAIAIAELLWKMRRAGKSQQVQEAIGRWEHSENVLIDPFDLEIVKLMLENPESPELHDEMIAMSCRRHNTNIIYATDENFSENFGLELRSWK